MSIFRILPLLLLVVGLHASAQGPPCPPQFDDGFGAVPCCAPAAPLIPPMPALNRAGIYTSWLDCAPTNSTINVAVGPMTPVDCDHFLLPTTMTFNPGPLAYTGNLVAKYSRTWLVNPNDGTPPGQVWRYILNGDLVPSQPANGLTVPICSAAFSVGGNPVVHFTGSIDYFCQTIGAGGPWKKPWEPNYTPPNPPLPPPPGGTPLWDFRIDLTHFSECIHHHPASARPWAGAPLDLGMTFSFVAPPLNNVGPIVPPPQNPLPFYVLDAMRESQIIDPFNPGQPSICFGQYGVGNMVVANGAQGCVCPQAPGPQGRYTDRAMSSLNLTCPGSVTIPTSGVVTATDNPNLGTGYVEFYLGNYGPGSPNWLLGMDVWSIYQQYLWYPMCSLAHIFQNYLYWEGIGTDTNYNGTSGVQVALFNGGLVQQCLDMANQLQPSPVTFGGWANQFGAPAASNHVTELSQ